MIVGFVEELQNFLLNNEKCSSDEMELLLEVVGKFEVVE